MHPEQKNKDQKFPLIIFTKIYGFCDYCNEYKALNTIAFANVEYVKEFLQHCNEINGIPLNGLCYIKP